MPGFTPEMRAKAQETKRLKAEAKKAEAAAPADIRRENVEEEAPLAMPPLQQPAHPPMPEAEAEPIAEPSSDPFERFLAAQDEEIRGLLSDVELRVIYEADLKKQQEAKREAAKKLAQQRASQFNKVEIGLIAPEDAERAAWQRRMNRKVTYTPTIPVDPNGNQIDVGYRVDGEIVYSGLPWTGTYAEYLSLREQEWRAMNHEMDFEGKGKVSQHRRLALESTSLVATV